MKYIYFFLLSIISIPLFGCSDKNEQEDKEFIMPPVIGTPLLWGIDNAGSDLNYDAMDKAIDYFGFNLVVHHYTPLKSQNSDNLRALSNFYKKKNVRLILNLESANNDGSSFIDDNGFDWFNRPDGRHFFMFPDDVLETLATFPKGTGVMYDEAEHMQNRFRMDVPYFMKQDDASSLAEANKVFTLRMREIVDHYEKYGIDVYTEHVFPIQFHTFANAGVIPVSKVLKESCIPAYIACALGASIQYEKPFWLSPDLWFYNEYPGHNAEQYRSALLMAYHMGAEGIYTENLAYPGDFGKGGLILMDKNQKSYKVTKIGEVARWFRANYAPNNPRNYKHSELIPKVAIIRQEDACWGQAGSWLEDQLFGVENWKSTEETEAWLGIWNLLSNGNISSHSLCWNNNQVYATPYQVFFPLDGVVVFDENVTGKHLKNVELIFLTGIGISETTLNAVESLVKEGTICVSLPNLIPSRVKTQTGDNGILNDGKGKWIISKSFLTDEVKENIKPFLPQENYIRYQFGNKEIQFRPIGNNPDKVAVSIQSIEN